MEGIIPIHKPAGWTSHDVVARMRRILKIKRIGHTGTLDPAVTGVLLLCVGRATRLVEYMQDLPKEYEAELTVGYSTDTEDSSGVVTEMVEHVQLTKQQTEQVLLQFHGPVQQIPPMYSALKHNGKKLYELAREGQWIERKSREITIYHIELLKFDDNNKFPIIHIRARCSKGTYIRTLCVDIGRKLGYPSVMSSLVRTATGGVTLDMCYTLEEVEKRVEQGATNTILLPLDEAIAHIPAVVLDPALVSRALNGQHITVPEQCLTDFSASEGDILIRLYDNSNSFLGIFSLQMDSLLLTPVKVFLPQNIHMDNEI